MGYFDKNKPVGPPANEEDVSARKRAALQAEFGPSSVEYPAPAAEAPASPFVPVRRVWRLWHLYGALGLMAGFCFVGASYSAYTAEQLNPGQVVFNNSLTPVFRAGYLLTLILTGALLAIRAIWPELHNYFRADVATGIDLNADLKAVSPAHRLWLFVSVFSVLCWVATMLLTAKPPESVSVGP